MKKSKFVYIVGSVAIGVVALLIVFFALLASGAIKASRTEIVISSATATYVYDGYEHSSKEYRITQGSVKAGHRVSVISSSRLTEAGEIVNEIEAKIVDAAGADVSEEYKIEYDFGKLIVAPRPITVQSFSSEKEYDGEPLSYSEEVTLTEGSVAGGETISYAFHDNHIVYTGTIENKFTATVYRGGADVTKNYEITYLYGSLRVTGPQLFITSPSARKIYDGTPLTTHGVCTTVETNLKAGHTLTCEAVGSQTDAGTGKNTVLASVKDASGKDVTGQYELVISEGELVVEPVRLVIVTEDAVKVYDGEPLVAHGYELGTAAGLIAGHRIEEIVMLSAQIDCGSMENIVTDVVIVDGSGRRMTENYAIEYVCGHLTVTQRPVTIQSKNASKDYDGTPLICREYEIVPENGILSGHRINVYITGERTEVGESESTIAGATVLETATGKDVSFNYQIKYENGSLIVKGSGGSTGPGGSVADGSGSSLRDDGEIGAIGGVGSGTAEEKDAARVYAENAGRLYLRYLSYGDYTGKGWTEGKNYGKTIAGGFSANYLTSAVMEGTGLQSEEIRILALGKDYLVPYYPKAERSDFYTVQTSDVKYTGKTSLEYRVSAYRMDILEGHPTFSIGKNSSYERAYREFVYENYLTVPGSTRSYLEGVIAENSFGGNRYEQISAVANYIREAATYNMDYDRALDRSADIAVAFLRYYKSGICQHYATAATLLFRTLGIPARYPIGYAGDTVAGQYTTFTEKNAHAWVEVYLDSVGWVYVEVTGAGPAFDEQGGNSQTGNRLTVKPVDEYLLYDGVTELVPSGKVQGIDSLLKQGYTYRATVTGSRTAAGIGKSRITSFTLYDAGGNDVTGLYSIAFEEGMLQVYLREISVFTGSANKVYDGSPLTCPDIAKSGELLTGHTLTAFAAVGTITDVGKVYNAFELRILDGNGQDVTEYYKVNKSEGTLTVTPKELTVTAASAEKAYDGSALADPNYTVEGLAQGDRATAVVTGSQTKIGVGVNLVSEVKIQNASGKDVTGNYTVVLVHGKLTVYPPT